MGLETNTRRRALVLGGSIAGLTAARVLADRFDEVVLVERDKLDTTIDPRKGVPQGRHLHVLLKRGEDLLARWFPDLVAQLQADGAVPVDATRDVAWYHFGGWKKRHESGFFTLCMTRTLLEMRVRERVLGRANVRAIDEADVIDLATTGERATGATIKRRASGAIEELVEADLVVDASGRGSKLPEWLAARGYGDVEETRVRVNVGYASRLYARPDPSPFDWKVLYVLGPAPSSRRLGVIMPLEGNRYIATLAGMLGDHAPEDPEGWLEFTRALPVPDLHDALARLEPLGPVVATKFASNQRRRYERMHRFPEGLVVVGDAFTSFNPIYGQGMTAACLDANALGAALDAHGRAPLGLAKRYHAAAAKLADAPWLMTTAEDFRHEDVEGKRPPLYAALRWYFGRVHRAVMVDGRVYDDFLRAMHLIDRPEALLGPSAIARVLRAARRADDRVGQRA